MAYSRATWEGKVAYDPHFEVQRTCRNWDKINDWAQKRSVCPSLVNFERYLTNFRF